MFADDIRFLISNAEFLTELTARIDAVRVKVRAGEPLDFPLGLEEFLFDTMLPRCAIDDRIRHIVQAANKCRIQKNERLEACASPAGTCRLSAQSDRYRSASRLRRLGSLQSLDPTILRPQSPEYSGGLTRHSSAQQGKVG